MNRWISNINKDPSRFGTHTHTHTHDLGASDYRRVMDWRTDLLTTCIHHSELQAITAPLLISRIHRSPQHPLSLLPACCVFTSRSLRTASNSGDSSASRAHVATVRRISCNWTLVDCQPSYSAISSQPSLQSSTQLPTFNRTDNLIVFKITPRRGPHRKHSSSIVASVSFFRSIFTEPLLINGLLNPVVLLLRACIMWALPTNGHCLHSPLSNRSIRHNIYR
jgi:hypothetical protein